MLLQSDLRDVDWRSGRRWIFKEKGDPKSERMGNRGRLNRLVVLKVQQLLTYESAHFREWLFKIYVIVCFNTSF